MIEVLIVGGDMSGRVMSVLDEPYIYLSNLQDSVVITPATYNENPTDIPNMSSPPTKYTRWMSHEGRLAMVESSLMDLAINSSSTSLISAYNEAKYIQRLRERGQEPHSNQEWVRQFTGRPHYQETRNGNGEVVAARIRPEHRMRPSYGDSNPMEEWGAELMRDEPNPLIEPELIPEIKAEEPAKQKRRFIDRG